MSRTLQGEPFRVDHSAAPAVALGRTICPRWEHSRSAETRADFVVGSPSPSPSGHIWAGHACPRWCCIGSQPHTFGQDDTRRGEMYSVANMLYRWLVACSLRLDPAGGSNLCSRFFVVGVDRELDYGVFVNCTTELSDYSVNESCLTQVGCPPSHNC